MNQWAVKHLDNGDFEIIYPPNDSADFATPEINWNIVARCMKAYPERATLLDKVIQGTLIVAAWFAAARIFVG